MIQEISPNVQGNLTKAHDLSDSFFHYVCGRVHNHEEGSKSPRTEWLLCNSVTHRMMDLQGL